MDGGAVPNHEQFSGHMLEQDAEELGCTFAIDAALVDAEVEPLNGQPGDQ